MRKVFAFVTGSIALTLALTGCANSDRQPNSEMDARASDFNWTKEDLLKVQIDPVTLKKFEFTGNLGRGSAEAQASNDPNLVQRFAIETLPSKCAAISSVLQGSLDLGDELKLSQFSEESSSGNALYQWVRTFPSSALASQRFKEFAAAAPSCGLYTYIKKSGESEQFNLWASVLDSTDSSIIASGEYQFFSVGYEGSAIYFQWLIFDSQSAPSKSEMLETANGMQQTVKKLLNKAQGIN